MHNFDSVWYFKFLEYKKHVIESLKPERFNRYRGIKLRINFLSLEKIGFK